MHNMHPNFFAPLSFGFCIVLEVSALAILLLARQYSRLKNIGGALLAFTSKGMFALPALVLVALVVKNMSPTISVQPYMYAIGAPLSCVLLDLCLHLD